MNLHTKEGRGTHADEMEYQLLDQDSGTTHVLRRSALRGPGEGTGVHGVPPTDRASPQPPYVVQSDRTAMGGVLGPLETEPKGPRRH